MPDVWGLAAILSKFGLYLGILTASGTVFATLLFQLIGTARFAIWFAVLGLVASAASFCLRGAALTGDAAGMVDPEMLSLLWSTPVGDALIYRLVGLSMLIAGVLLGGWGMRIAASGGVIAVLSFVQIGHIPDLAQWPYSLLLALHLLYIAVWIGILSPLRQMVSHDHSVMRGAYIGHSFGKFAIGAVPGLAMAGIYLAYRLVGSWSALVTTSYGQILIAKIILVVGLLGFAGLNKFWFVPRLFRNEPHAGRQMAQVIGIEWAIIVLILLVTATLTSIVAPP